MDSGRIFLLADLAATWFLAGLIWFVQVVHYPLFDAVGPERFRPYHAAHTRRTTRVVLLPMVVELATSVALAIRGVPGKPAWMTRVGLGLVVLIWASTALVQVPIHRRLADGPDPALSARLVASNAARTLCWTLHALLLLALVA